LYDELEEQGINKCVQNKTTFKFAKNHGNWFRHFEDISRRCEPSNVVAYFFGPPSTYHDDNKLAVIYVIISYVMYSTTAY